MSTIALILRRKKKLRNSKRRLHNNTFAAANTRDMPCNSSKKFATVLRLVRYVAVRPVGSEFEGRGRLPGGRIPSGPLAENLSHVIDRQVQKHVCKSGNAADNRYVPLPSLFL